MIAKLIVHADTRDAAAARLATVCADVEVWPIRTNAAFLATLLREPDFLAGDITTGFIAAEGERLTASAPLSDAMAVHGLTLLREGLRGEWPIGDRLTGFRLNASVRDRSGMVIDGATREVEIDQQSVGHLFGDEDFGNRFIGDGSGFILFEGGNPHRVTLRHDANTGAGASNGTLLAPMPGRITAVEVAPGDAVTKGQRLVTLEAMKMEHALTAPFDGVVAELNATPGAQVQVDALLVRVEAKEA
jgi:3-methylcrotonyl-CoA carboxylase alpha subunit